MQTDPTSYANSNELLEQLLAGMQKILGENLVGLYLYGSLVTGDFEKEFPQWTSLIENALVWREAWRDEQVEHDATRQETLEFVRFAISQCENTAGGSKSNPLI